jgi:hypothetical protein
MTTKEPKSAIIYTGAGTQPSSMTSVRDYLANGVSGGFHQ